MPKNILDQLRTIQKELETAESFREKKIIQAKIMLIQERLEDWRKSIV